MDPVANWKELLESLNDGPLFRRPPEELERIYDLAFALHDWVTRNGFLPTNLDPALTFTGLLNLLDGMLLHLSQLKERHADVPV